MKHSPLSRVERLIRRVVEEPFTWFGSEKLDPFQLAGHLTRVYEDVAPETEQPNLFVIHVNPNDYREIESYGVQALARQVADYVVIMAGRRGHHLSQPPTIRFESHAQEQTHSAHVTVSRVVDQHLNTDVYAVEDNDGVQEAIRSADAFLIVQGRQHIALDRPITRIGRRIENDIVLDSPSISRQHAQIRWRQRYFVLYDVSGHGRTAVNGAPAQEHVLRPGDVIALSDIFLVYGEGRDALSATSTPADGEELGTTMLKPEE